MDYSSDEGISDSKPGTKPVPLFTFHTVNSCGSAQFNTIANNGELINFSSALLICLCRMRVKVVDTYLHTTTDAL